MVVEYPGELLKFRVAALLPPRLFQSLRVGFYRRQFASQTLVQIFRFHARLLILAWCNDVWTSSGLTPGRPPCAFRTSAGNSTGRDGNRFRDLRLIVERGW